jgi:AhpD family alkylhydroperoxidase
MATVRLISDEDATAEAKAVFDDIRATRGTDYVNNFWRALAVDPAQLASVWSEVKAVMSGPGTLDPLTREMIYIAVSTANACAYCAHSHTASARAKGMTDAQYRELLALIGLAARTNHLANALQVPVDAAFDADAGRDR